MNKLILTAFCFISSVFFACKQQKLGMDPVHYSSDEEDRIYSDIVPVPPAGTKQLVSFDYAIKHLLRSKTDYEILESFISSILTHYGGPEIEILELLESETNKGSKKDKGSLVDMLVKDKYGNKYIVEIERNIKRSFFHKALYTTSRTIVDSLAAGMDYSTIKKVYHINLLYFTPDKNMSSLCRGKTIYHNINNEEIDILLELDERDRNGNKIIVHASNITPDYFIISIPEFEKRESTNALEDWFYILKNDTVPEIEHLPQSCIKKIENKLTYLKLPEEKKNAYQRYILRRTEKQIDMNRAKEEGREEERIKNFKKNQERKRKIIEKVVKKGLSKNNPIDVIRKKARLAINNVFSDCSDIDEEFDRQAKKLRTEQPEE
ncbi:PD-(D/E)XK nuclease family transposase [Cardinium endosymbiont of Culicoides punctatus]|uniref:PD-(D/E)XK nuclease family transposase n=1 Tax=Cardinium endosymbiont of Culicoides punctatus TaxID=2304601 RepID=UPI001058D13C|nr:PD-(D/E)XK nuclease family transposase [Cardinium endosymbiont of Culicoides punctatus]TDG95650.1 hypothetical protein CCPUN_01060 [Cardinium endosymbiont of Culicoides punctatus]